MPVQTSKAQTWRSNSLLIFVHVGPPREFQVQIADVEEGRELGETQMRLSHEIIVLDYGDEQNSPFDNPEKTSSENKKNELLES